jgi:hypothetical protein
VTPSLVRELERAKDRDFIEVIVELYTSVSSEHLKGLTRAAAIEARKHAFDAAVAAVARVISSLGGIVLRKAWVNETIQVQIPAGQVNQVAALENVRVVDTPHHISIESA